jgi:hypothetical protein
LLLQTYPKFGSFKDWLVFDLLGREDRRVNLVWEEVFIKRRRKEKGRKI